MDRPEHICTNDHALRAILSPMHEALGAHGITPEYLVKKLKAELNAKETKTIKIKGAVGDLGRGFKVVTTSGLVEFEKEGDKVFSDGETLIRSDQVAWGVRQKARMDAQKLLDLYPAEKHELDFKKPLIVEIVQFNESDCRKSNNG